MMSYLAGIHLGLNIASTTNDRNNNKYINIELPIREMS